MVVPWPGDPTTGAHSHPGADGKVIRIESCVLRTPVVTLMLTNDKILVEEGSC